MSIVVRVTWLYEGARDALRLEGTDVRRFQKGAQHPLCGHGVPPDKVPVASDHAAEVLRPRSIRGHVDHHVSNPLLTEYQRCGWSSQDGVEFPFGQESRPLSRGVYRPGVCYPRNVLVGIQSHVRRHGREEEVRRRCEPG